MKNSKLIIVDGIPGSGKSTTGEWLSAKLNATGIANYFYHELADKHPLRIYDKVIEGLDHPDEAEWFKSKVTGFMMSDEWKRDRFGAIERSREMDNASRAVL